VNLEEIKAVAQKEVDAETHRALIEREKENIRRRKRFWLRIWPWRIVLQRRDQVTNAEYYEKLYNEANGKWFMSRNENYHLIHRQDYLQHHVESLNLEIQKLKEKK
jgi:hypothetical protein